MSGTWASGWALNDVVSVAEFAKGVGCVADSTLGASAASFDLTSIPTTYAHLCIELFLRGDTAAITVGVNLRLNNDSGANYIYESLTSSGATVTGASATAQTSISAGSATAASATASVFSSLRIEIPHYTSTVGTKNVLCYMGQAATPALYLTYGHWSSTTAVNRLTILPAAGNWITGSRASIYVKGA